MLDLSFALKAPVVEALGWTLLHSLWQGAVVMLVLAVILGLTKDRQAHTRYGFSVAALSLMLFWSVLTFFNHYQHPSSLDLSGKELIVTEIEETFESAIVIREVPQAAESSLPFSWWAGWERVEAFMHAHGRLIAAAWLLGSLLFFLKWLGSLLYLHRVRRSSLNSVSGRWQRQLDKLARSMGILKPVLLVESVRVHTPMVLGHLKPIILLPVGMLTGMAPQQLEAILIHELAHVRRHDYYVNLVQSALEVMYFYHPAYWWISARIKDEREHCCDDIAVAVCGNAVTYARALNAVQSWNQPQEGPSLALAALGRKNHLLHRIKRLITPERSNERTYVAGKVVLSFLLLLSVWGLIWLDGVPEARAEEQDVASDWSFSIDMPEPVAPLAPLPPRPPAKPVPPLEPLAPNSPRGLVMPGLQYSKRLGQVFVDSPGGPYIYQFSPSEGGGGDFQFEFRFGQEDAQAFEEAYAEALRELERAHTEAMSHRHALREQIEQTKHKAEEVRSRGMRSEAYDESIRLMLKEFAMQEDEALRRAEEALALQEELMSTWGAQFQRSMGAAESYTWEWKTNEPREWDGSCDCKDDEARTQPINSVDELVAIFERRFQQQSQNYEEDAQVRVQRAEEVRQRLAELEQEQALHEQEAQLRQQERALHMQEQALRERERGLQREEAFRQRAEEKQEEQRRMEREQRAMEREQRAMLQEMERVKRDMEATHRDMEGRFQAMSKDLRENLEADGLVRSDEQDVTLQLNGDGMRVNGRRLNERQYLKYKNMLENHGFQVSPGSSIAFDF